MSPFYSSLAGKIMPMLGKTKTIRFYGFQRMLNFNLRNHQKSFSSIAFYVMPVNY